ncbi:MAG: acetyl-CoA carboxylase biotin carboxyl carrier protein [Firmicutes bacterium]|nr:acetyl-CoA carboxylase biotin carboxyl carrier protein [Bacillota bacterium]
MNESNIRKYAKLMKELDLTGLEITEDNKVVRLERTPGINAEPSVLPQPVPEQEKAAPEPKAEAGDCVLSPIVGVFYAAPAENAEPFVKVGDTVKKGDTLCIIEAMKLMNEITAEQDGTIVEICVTNGQVVEYGSPLFRIER